MYIDRNSNKICWFDLKKYAQYTNLGPAKFYFKSMKFSYVLNPIYCAYINFIAYF